MKWQHEIIKGIERIFKEKQLAVEIKTSNDSVSVRHNTLVIRISYYENDNLFTINNMNENHDVYCSLIELSENFKWLWNYTIKSIQKTDLDNLKFK